jgi:hypothetical protein
MKKRTDYTEAWFNFMEELEAAKNSLGFEKNEECFFRGHTHESHKLTPGLLRSVPGNDKEIPWDLWYAEYSCFYEFRARAKDVHQGDLSDWDILFLCSTTDAKQDCWTGQRILELPSTFLC